MLEVTIPEMEIFDEDTNTFIAIVKKTTLRLEHSLISLKKWESKWHKPFLGKENKTPEEISDYIRCMTINQVDDPAIYKFIPANVIEQVVKYIEDPMTATWFSNSVNANLPKSRGRIVTNELIYYWMIALNIPVEFQKWHLNQLLTLIKVVNIENGPKKKMSRKEEAQQRAALNAARRAKYNSKG